MPLDNYGFSAKFGWVNDLLDSPSAASAQSKAAPCHSLILGRLAQAYSLAAGYPIYERFTNYAVTGDAGDWLVSKDIPSVSVELITHETLDWPQNLAGMMAVLEKYHLIPKSER